VCHVLIYQSDDNKSSTTYREELTTGLLKLRPRIERSHVRINIRIPCPLSYHVREPFVSQALWLAITYSIRSTEKDVCTCNIDLILPEVHTRDTTIPASAFVLETVHHLSEESIYNLLLTKTRKCLPSYKFKCTIGTMSAMTTQTLY
jgi:hypothetical protein